MKRRTKIWIGAVAVAAVGGGVTAVSAARGSDGEDLRTVAAERGTVVDEALAVGRIEPEVEVEVKSQLSGVVRREFADIGDFVRKGEPLLEVQPNPTPQELVQARRQVELEEVALEDLRKKRDRLSALAEKNYVSQEEFEAVERQYEQARIQLQMARERLALFEDGRVTIGRENVETVIKSPIDGFILEKAVEIGDPVVPLTSFQQGTVLLSMAEMEHLIFRGTVDEIDVGRLEEGMPATIKIGALPEAAVEGVLTSISLKGREEENATVFPVEISVRAVEGTVLRAGYSANAEIVIEKREDVLVIPERLVSFGDEATTVTVLRPDGTTEEREIEAGLSDGITLEVLSGLEEGDRVVEPEPREIS